MNNSDMPIAPITRETESMDGAFLVGLTKREYFAGKQMAAIQADLKGTMSDAEGIQWMAEIAVKQADALLQQLQATEGGE